MESLRLIVRYSILGTLLFYVMVCMFCAAKMIFEIGLDEFMRIDLGTQDKEILLGGIFLFISLFVAITCTINFAFPEIRKFILSGGGGDY